MISKKDITSFTDLYLSKTGIELSTEEAEDKANKLIKLVKSLLIEQQRKDTNNESRKTQ